ncbi:MAG: hypothetical protein WD063_04695 [Pirellulales bacterium]
MRAMNCDQVFDVLTRGPFPTGTPCDVPVEAHLCACPQCRRLAEALRPALELFQESVDPEESRDLPGYWSAVASDRQAVVSFAPEVEPQRASRVGSSGALAKDWVTAWRLAAMLALGVTLGTLMSARMGLDGFKWSPFGADASRAPLVPERENPSLTIAARIDLAALPAACYRQEPDGGPRNGPHENARGDQLPAGAELPRLSCCSGCHHVASETVPRAATVKVAQTCQLCHNDQPFGQLELAP